MARLSKPPRGGMLPTSLWKVSCRGEPPSTGMTYTWRVPLYWPVKAIDLQSGENLGASSSPSPEVSRRAGPSRAPVSGSTGMDQRSAGPSRAERKKTRSPRGPQRGAWAIGCSGAILALANVDVAGCARAWEGDGGCQRELINAHRAGALAGIAGVKRALFALHGTSMTTRIG